MTSPARNHACQGKDEFRPDRYASKNARVRARAIRVFGEDHALSAAGLDWRYAHHGGLGEIFSRVRRFAVLDALAANGFGCAHGAGVGDVASRYLAADFVAAPQGKGRSCFREWEALAAGAIPLVDWDASAAMAELYDGLPVVRVRDWRNVTRAFLDAEFARVAASRADVRKVYLPFWLHEFTAS